MYAIRSYYDPPVQVSVEQGSYDPGTAQGGIAVGGGITGQRLPGCAWGEVEEDSASGMVLRSVITSYSIHYTKLYESQWGTNETGIRWRSVMQSRGKDKTMKILVPLDGSKLSELV